MSIRRTCKEVAALLIAREDRALPLAERLGLRLHLAMCAGCTGFERQILTMHNVMRQWRNYEAPDESAPNTQRPTNSGA